MKKRLTTCLVIALAGVLFASTALAWRSVRTGQKNFERAWRSYLSKQPDKAYGYFARSADGFAEALAEDPPGRTTLFSSNLTMAGLAFYHAGRYREAVSTMKRVADKNDSIWEAYIIAALSQGRLGNESKMADALKAYLDAAPGQLLLSGAVKREQAALEKGTQGVENAVSQVEQAMLDQFERNDTFSKNNVPSSKEYCSGTFWWRYNKAPCDRDYFNFTD